MKNLDYKDNELEIKFLLKLLKNLSPTDDTYQYLMNELLIYVYTSYENFLKKILVFLFADAKQNFKYNPFLIEHSLWGIVNNEDKKFMVPKGKIEDLKVNFPLIKESYFIDELSAIDTLILARNSFAHTGQNNATLEQILNAYLTSKYIIKYLDFCYVTSTDIERSKLKSTQLFLKNLVNHTEGCIKSIKEDNFSPTMKAFDCHYIEYISFKNSGIFDFNLDLSDLFLEENFIFLSNYTGKPVGTFVGKLDSLKSLLYLKAFKVNDKDNLKPRDILVILD